MASINEAHTNGLPGGYITNTHHTESSTLDTAVVDAAKLERFYIELDAPLTGGGQMIGIGSMTFSDAGAVETNANVDAEMSTWGGDYSFDPSGGHLEIMTADGLSDMSLTIAASTGVSSGLTAGDVFTNYGPVQLYGIVFDGSEGAGTSNGSVVGYYVPVTVDKVTHHLFFPTADQDLSNVTFPDGSGSSISTITNVDALEDGDSSSAGTYVAYVDLAAYDSVITGTNEPDRIVTGTDSGDLIDASFTGDPDGDQIDNNDGNPNSETGDDDSVVAGAGNDTVLSSLGNDTIRAGAGDDSVNAGVGDDLIEGGAGKDVLTGGDGDDTFIYVAGDGADTITDFGAGESGSDTDGDQSNNDFIDLSAFYNATTLDAVNASSMVNNYNSELAMLRADAADGTIDGIIYGVDYSAQIGDIDLTLENGGTFVTGKDLTFDNTNVICFTRGTLIKTIEGERAIEELRQGDLVWTKDNGFQTIRWIGSKVLSEDLIKTAPNLRPVRILAGALGQGLPKRDLMVSPQHRILVNSKISNRMTHVDEVLVSAKHLLQLQGFDYADLEHGVEYYHFLFDRHEIVEAEGAQSESLFTGPEALKAVDPEARAEILAIFPELAELDYSASFTSVRPILSGRQSRKLTVRHKQNRKSLLMGTV